MLLTQFSKPSQWWNPLRRHPLIPWKTMKINTSDIFLILKWNSQENSSCIANFLFAENLVKTFHVFVDMLHEKRNDILMSLWKFEPFEGFGDYHGSVSSSLLSLFGTRQNLIHKIVVFQGHEPSLLRHYKIIVNYFQLCKINVRSSQLNFEAL